MEAGQERRRTGTWPPLVRPSSPCWRERRAEQERAGVAAVALSREPTVRCGRGWVWTAVGVALWDEILLSPPS
jgi:hypothetical protein